LEHTRYRAPEDRASENEVDVERTLPRRKWSINSEVDSTGSDNKDVVGVFGGAKGSMVQRFSSMVEVRTGSKLVNKNGTLVKAFVRKSP
jgi:hypothetical protein